MHRLRGEVGRRRRSKDSISPQTRRRRRTFVATDVDHRRRHFARFVFESNGNSNLIGRPNSQIMAIQIRPTINVRGSLIGKDCVESVSVRKMTQNERW